MTRWHDSYEQDMKQMFADFAAQDAETAPYAPRYQPDNCPHCAYDRRFPETADGGWIYPGNNAALVPCGMCNPHGTFPRTKS